MGKQSRSKRRKRVEIPDPGRRKLIIGGLGLVAVVSTLTASGITRNILRDDTYGFLERPRLDYPKKWREFSSYNVPLGPEDPFNDVASIEKMLQQKMPEIRKALLARGIRQNNPTVTITQQFYGIPDEDRFTKPLLDYCRRAIDFLYSKLRGLNPFTLEWVVLHPGANYEVGYNNKAFVLNSWVEIYRIKLVEINGESLLVPPIANPNLRQSGNVVNRYDENHNLLWRYMIISEGPTALQAPFSETIHLTTSKVGKEHPPELSRALEQTEEALSEGISYMLSLDFARLLGISRGVETIEGNLRKMMRKPDYKYLQDTIRWMQQHGIQNAFDLYMERPQKFMDAILRKS